MDYYFRNGSRQIGKEKITIKVKYTIKGRQINYSTDIYAVEIDLYDGENIKNHWCHRILVPIIYSSSYAFHSFVEKFIKTVLITVSEFLFHWRS